MMEARYVNDPGNFGITLSPDKGMHLGKKADEIAAVAFDKASRNDDLFPVIFCRFEDGFYGFPGRFRNKRAGVYYDRIPVITLFMPRST